MLKDLILKMSGTSVFDFISKYIDIDETKTCLVGTTDESDLADQSENYGTIINLSKVNDIRYINKYFKKVNSQLAPDGKFVCCFETITTRRAKSWFGKIPVFKNVLFSFEFMFLRVAPKIWGIKKIYFGITKGRNRLLSRAEVLGRLV